VASFVQGAYILAALLFILALAGLSKHETARRGNQFGMAGMGLALVATLLLVLDYLGTDTGDTGAGDQGPVVVGAILQAPIDNLAVQVIAGVAILLASINVFGGFLVTRRMLNMFQKG